MYLMLYVTWLCVGHQIEGESIGERTDLRNDVVHPLEPRLILYQLKDLDKQVAVHAGRK